ncbi:MAG: NAD(P)-dependent alcohol dehydrogenase [Acidobacteriota bacterium]|nr:MAG: NAD(P)-dependent alcohol dehydrogenase [Acidobacteriota bacterium]
MRVYSVERFGLAGLALREVDEPTPGPGQVVVDVKALSLNYRDLMVVKGAYNPKLPLPATPISDGAGVVSGLGAGISGLTVGQRVVSHFIADWQQGPYRGQYVTSTLGAPGPGLAAEKVVLPAHAVLPIPDGYDFAQAATLPIAALTAWSALVTEGRLEAGQTVLTLGTGGVSIFALQLAMAMGARVIITSRSDEKLERARKLGADFTVNCETEPNWDTRVLELTGAEGVDITVETSGAGTLDRSFRATRAGGLIALIGVLSGAAAQVTAVTMMMRRQRLHGILVDSREAFEAMNRFLVANKIRPVIDQRFPFEQLRDAFDLMASGRHFGKIVIDV